MSSFNPAFGGFGYEHSSKQNFSPGNLYELRPGFGRSSNHFGCDPFTGGISVPAIGHSDPFGYAPTSSGTSAPAFGHSSHPFGYAPTSSGTYAHASGHSSHPFGFTPSNGGTSAPAFGHSSHPFGYAPTSGGTSAHAFGHSSHPFGYAPTSSGTSTHAFGHSSHPFGYAPTSSGTSAHAFGHSSHPFGYAPASGGTSVPAFGHCYPYGFIPSNGGTSMPAFGQSTNPFGYVPANGGTSVPAFGRNSNSFGFTPSNGGTSVPSFWQSTNPFGSALTNGGGTSVPAFGRSSNSFGFTPSNTRTSVPAGEKFGFFPTNGGTPVTAFGEGRNYFASAPTNGETSVPTCGAPLSSTSMQAASSSPIWGVMSGSTSSFQTPAFNTSNSPGFGFGSTTCSQPTFPSGTSSLFGTRPYPFGTQNHLSGDHVKTPLFGGLSSGPLTFSVNRGGSRVNSYTETVDGDASSHLSTRIMSISAMPVYRKKCHEELRWEDKQLGDDGTWGNIPLFDSIRSGQSAIGGQSKGSTVKLYTKTPVVEDKSRATSISAMPVYQDKSHEELRWEDYQFNNAGGGVDPPNPVASSPPCFSFPTCSTPFTSNSFFNGSRGGTCTSITQPPFIFGPTSPFSLPSPSIISSSGSEASTFGPSLFNYTSAPYASICSTSVTAPVTASVPCNFPPTISTVDAVSPSSCRAETPPAAPQMSAEGPKTTSVRYGISTIPVSDMPSPIRSSPSLTTKHSAYERQKQLPTPKYNRKGDGPKVTFSTDAHKTPTTARKKVPLLPEDNSRTLVSRPSEEWNLRIDLENISHIKNTSIHVYENGNGEVSVELSTPLVDGSMYQDKVGNSGETSAAEHGIKPNSVNGNHPFEKEVSSDVYGLMPKLKHSDYFTEPRVEDLEIKESFEPGFCSHVKDFVVGHQRHGRIKFLGKTDVRQLDVNSHIVFRDREVILSMDENKKPPVGQGLNKAAEITLCNVKCVDKAGNHYINGPKVDKYKKRLMKKAAEQGAEFVSYDPVQGEWKFRVEHF